MEKIRIQNLKSIKDSGYVDIKPLTILIGKNSSGKSSFVRTFPLLKQSFLRRLSSPILWYGDYVDFGSFNNSLCESRENGKDFISISTTFKVATLRPSRLRMKQMETDFSIKITKEFIKEFVFSLEGHTLSLILDDNKVNYKIYIDGSIFEIDKLFTNKGRLFPDSERRPMGYYYFDFAAHGSFFEDARIDRYDLFRFIERSALDYTYIFDNDKLHEISLQALEKLSDKLAIDNKTEEFIKLLEHDLKTYLIVDFISSAFYSFENEFNNVSYFQPIRSRGDRFYRVQGFDVDEVDSDGINAPMVLYFMTKEKRKKFGDWCQKLFGFRYEITDSSGKSESTSVVVTDRVRGVKHNLTDVGFGYSQVLPIILSLWMQSEQKVSLREHHIVVLEQPELHLHPGFQKRVLKTIINIINQAAKSRTDIKFIVETHSESIVNYVCKKIADQTLNKNYVNLLVFDKENNETRIRKMEFNNDGTITNWPIGFFSEED